MILDETTASTSEEHFNDILDLVEREKNAGTSIIFVSHRLNEVFAMCDRIAVLRNGKLVKTLDAAETDADEITSLMIGQALKALARPAPVRRRSATRCRCCRSPTSTAGRPTGVSFDVNPGEILGLYGLVGSGRSSVARTITGQRPAVSGSIKLHGQEVEPADPDGRGQRRRSPT